MSNVVKMDFATWSAAATPTQTGSTDSNNLINDFITSLNSLLGALNTISFIENTRNLITALEDFGHGLSGALACVSLDLQVVSSGLSAAVAAFGSADAALAKTFADLETQLSYYTSTTSNATLATPSAADQAALNSVGVTTSGQSFWDTTAGHVVIGAGIVLAIVAVAVVVVITLPVDAIVAAGSAIIAAGATLFSSLASVF